MYPDNIILSPFTDIKIVGMSLFCLLWKNAVIRITQGYRLMMFRVCIESGRFELGIV